MRKNIIISLFIFFIISLISVYSAYSISDSMGNIFIKQIIYYFIGFIILIISYKYKNEIIKYHFLLYFILNILLLILLFMGISINGSRCWIIIGPISFQPSEFMKLSLILTISAILFKNKNKKTMKEELFLLLKIFIILIIPSTLTFLEPDTGVVIIYIIIFLSLIFYRGINRKWHIIFIILLFILTCFSFYIYYFQKDLLINTLGNNLYYRLDRIINWSNKNGYQLDNSLIAIASSGLFGFGINNIPIYFPEASTDFIFTSFSSCFGFIGSVILIIIIIIFDISIIKLINKKKHSIDNYILIGTFCMILYQQFQNISMTIGILPITGITLPFISYGGSSLLSYMFILGIVLNISTYQKKYIN